METGKTRGNRWAFAGWRVLVLCQSLLLTNRTQGVSKLTFFPLDQQVTKPAYLIILLSVSHSLFMALKSGGTHVVSTVFASVAKTVEPQVNVTKPAYLLTQVFYCAFSQHRHQGFYVKLGFSRVVFCFGQQAGCRQQPCC